LKDVVAGKIQCAQPKRKEVVCEFHIQIEVIQYCFKIEPSVDQSLLLRFRYDIWHLTSKIGEIEISRKPPMGTAEEFLTINFSTNGLLMAQTSLEKIKLEVKEKLVNLKCPKSP